jgi:hypothetical protein
MILLCIDACILIFITTGLGVLLQKGLEKIFGTAIRSDLPGIFLLGLIPSTVYFNLLSFWLPVDYWSLPPLAALSLFSFFRFRETWRFLLLPVNKLFPIDRLPSVRRPIPKGPVFPISRTTYLLPAFRQYLLPAFCLFLLLFLYAIKPPTNPDSVDYHFLSILWGEKYRLIPGLANLYQPFAYNPASFLLQSAYSFTGLSGQSLYPLNPVITGLFLFWILARVYRHRDSLIGLIWFFFLLISYRYLLGNMSSPTSDALVQICLCYSLLRLSEALLSADIGISAMIVPCSILLYAPVAKLSAYPALMALFFVFCLLFKNKKRLPLLLTFLSMGLLIYLPWMGRNYIMSGYPVFPLPFLSFFHPDWKVPMNIMMRGYGRLQYCSKMLLEDGATLTQLQPVTFLGWFFPWIGKHLKYHLFIELFTFLSAILSPLLWIVGLALKKKPGSGIFIFWLLLYAACWIWLIGSPDYRYGTAFLVIAFLIPLLFLTRARVAQPVPRWLLSLLFILTTSYYLHGAYHAFREYGVRTTETFTWKQGGLFPIQDIYYKLHPKDSIPYQVLNNGVKVYLSDKVHLCINAGLVCIPNFDGFIGIEMRGPGVEDGFRTVREDKREELPLIQP